MCRQCWSEYGQPEIVNERVVQAASFVDVIYQDNSVGMPLHVQLDDWGIEGVWEPWADHEGAVGTACWIAAQKLCDLAKEMTIEERASFLALASGYFEIDTNKNGGRI